MKKWLKKNFKTYMIRPIIYKTVPRFLAGLAVALIWNRFINRSSLFTVTGYAFPILGILFLCLGWFSFLGMDGMGFRKAKSEKKKTKISYSDISDYVDFNITYDDLTGTEKSACNLAANLICSVVFFVLSIF